MNSRLKANLIGLLVVLLGGLVTFLASLLGLL